MNDEYRPPQRGWLGKFRDAFSGVVLGVCGQTSFIVHFVAAAAVIGCAACLRITATEWCLLVLCMTFVVTTELLNSALEVMAKAVDSTYNKHLEAALNIASGAVLVAAIGSAVIGAVIFTPHVLGLL